MKQFSESETDIILEYASHRITREVAVIRLIKGGTAPKIAHRAIHLVSVMRKLGLDRAQEVLVQCADAASHGIKVENESAIRAAAPAKATKGEGDD